MIWIIVMNVFIVSAAVGGEKWVSKTVLRMAAFFVCLTLAEKYTGAAVMTALILGSAWAAAVLSAAEKRKSRMRRAKKKALSLGSAA